MDAVMCNASAAKDPCAKYRPNCTATDYCAVGWYTEPVMVKTGCDKRMGGTLGRLMVCGFVIYFIVFVFITVLQAKRRSQVIVCYL